MVKPTQDPDQAPGPLLSSSWAQEPHNRIFLFPHLGGIFYIIPLKSAIDTYKSAHEVSLHRLLRPSIFLLRLCQFFQKFLYMQVGYACAQSLVCSFVQTVAHHTPTVPTSSGRALRSQRLCPSDHLNGSLLVNTHLLHMCYTDTVTMKSLVSGHVRDFLQVRILGAKKMWILLIVAFVWGFTGSSLLYQLFL